MRSSGRTQIGLALGGGGLRGLAHVGVLSVLAREGIPIDCVAGTSVGALVGAVYCAGLEMQRIREEALQVRWRDIASLVWPTQGFVTFANLERWLVKVLGDRDFADLTVPFAVVTADLETGQPVIVKRGPLAPAVRASCSVPGLVTPVALDGRLLSDGGVVDNLPTSVVRAMGADYVIGVDICHPSPRRRWGPFGFGFAALETLVRRAGRGLDTADCLISPDLARFSYLRFSERAEVIARGQKAAEEKLPLILKVVDN